MLVLPGPPRIFPIRPWDTLGEYARPKRGAKLLYLVGASVFGIPASPGYTKPVGAPGYCVDCWPGTSATILFCVSYHGVLYSQRNPKLRVRFERSRMESCP